jgi:hypothetical protein
MGVSGQCRPCRPLPPGKGPSVHFGEEAGWAPELVWTERLEEISSAEDQTSVVQSVVKHYTDWATNQRILIMRNVCVWKEDCTVDCKKVVVKIKHEST